ncbi:lantibiotic dehydratase [Streptomyces sp. TLI_171]|uniref:lantibiotic dehydratase n=1 Tax=Streptomyces sp. TLI_171 TaxID=1938859 RepID=UPI000C3B71E8|nr:lantibiotic dehydratase [Streptomyces sp. TLI_171]RKE17542.1 lantibiotic biosynthesis dehydratase-like protein [Streptomyces sp. TLI_171]
MTTTEFTAPPEGAAPNGGRSRQVLGPRFMLRAGGLPVEAVHGLRSDEVFDWAEELIAEEERLADLGARLSEPLSALVKLAEDAEQRRLVLYLRRRVFNNRLPERPAAALELVGRLDPATGELLAQWLPARRRLAQLQETGLPAFERELVRTRGELRRLAGLDELRLGLLLAAPSLEARLDGLAAPTATPDKRTRKAERSLLAYLYRTACKTSPFSTFTPVAVGTFSPAAGSNREERGLEGAGALDGAGVRLGAGRGSHPRLNVVVLARLAELVARDPVRRGDLPVAPASGMELTEDRVRYVRRSVTAGDVGAAVSFDAARDRLFFLRLSGVLEHLLELFRRRPLIRFGELAAALAAELDSGPEDAERYLEALLEVGILQLPLLATDVHTGDPLRAFRSALRSLERPWAEAVADRLAAPIAALDRYAAGDVRTRRALLAEVRVELLAVQNELGEQQAVLPQTLLYEDVDAGEVRADAGLWAELAAEPLAELGRMLPVFDLGLAQRLTLKGFFLARHGRGGRSEDLLQLVHDFHEDIFNQYLQFTATKSAKVEHGAYPPEENWLGLPEITALDRARAELVRRMRLRWEELPREVEELAITEADLAAVATELGALGGTFAPHSHFVQLSPAADDPRVVLNHSYGGLCFPFTRFTHCFESGEGSGEGGGLSAALGGTLREVTPPGAVLAEVTAGAATTNLNLHARLTDYELVCPGETSTAPEDAQIHLDDLYVEHDPDADRLVLRSRRLGAEVIPVYLGYLVPMVLPEIPRSLLLFSPTSRVTPELWRGVPTGAASHGVTRRPRVRYGSLVLHRRSWTAAADALPRFPPGAGESERYLEWQRWRRRHALPVRVFARAHPEGVAALGAAKPQYVDFASPLSLTALDGLLAGGAGRLVLEEMLPGEELLHVRSDQGRHVAELALEVLPGPRAAAPEPESTPRAEAAAPEPRQGEPNHD